MNQADQFGADPQVRAMRAIFAAMETAQEESLGKAGIGPLDPRLRAWRGQARQSFERAWPRAMSQGLARDPQGAARLYVLILADAMARAGQEAALSPQDGDSRLAALIGQGAR